jgi:4-amino-4-deoxy-L-arabinose transferase-like glycosyltransferase
MHMRTAAVAVHQTPAPEVAAGAPASLPAPAGWREIALIGAIILAWLAATAWMRPLMLPDEGRYVGVAWEMMRSGDWLTPTLNGLPFFHKPPLFYWITAGSMSLFGLHEWAARVAPVLGASVGALSMYLFTRRWSGERAARLTLVALLAQPLFYVGGQFANLDMLVAGCITATILLAAHAALSIGEGLPYRPALAGAYAMAAAGVLAKGLIGAVLPALVLLAWLLVLRRWRTLRALVWWPGLLLFLLICAPWFVAMQARFPDFLYYFFVVQHFKRFAAGGFNNVQPFWFYPGMLLLFCLPWLPWMARLRIRGATARDGHGAVLALLLLWVLVVVGFFSLPQSKLLGYILPAIPPLAALAVHGLLHFGPPAARESRWWQAGMAATAVLGLGTVVGLALFPPASSLRALAATLRSERAPGAPVFMLGKYYYDVPVYARLPGPVHVVDEWHAADVAAHDNGRKELADAGQFDPALAASVLITPASLPRALCGARTDWVIGPASARIRYRFLGAASVAFGTGDATLWKLDTSSAALRQALGCEQAPAPDERDVMAQGSSAANRSRRRRS